MKRAAAFLIAPLVCLAVFWDVLFTWFLNDDFAWLSLRLQLHRPSDLFRVVFEPHAQGTIRFLSDRLFFLLGTVFFGIHAVPFRVMGLVTWFLVLTLGSLIGTRLTGSRVAGIAAAIFWTTSYALVTPLSWSSSYDQLLCSLLILTAFYARLRWLDGGGTAWSIIEWGAYLLAFGALEIAIMYPFAALLYTWGSRPGGRPRALGSALLLLIPAVAFLAVHFLLIPKNSADIYTIHVDGKLPSTLMTYLRWSLGPSRLRELNIPDWASAGMTVTWLIGAALGGFVVWRLVKGDRTPGFCVAWFLIFLAPVLPLPNHISDYYLTLPLAGLAWLAGDAFVRAWKSNVGLRALSVLLAVAFFAGSITEISLSTEWYRARAGRMRMVYRATEQASASHPGAAVLLQHVDNALFQSGFQDDPFRLLGISRVYLAPGAEEGVDARKDLGGTSRFTIAPDEALRLFSRKELIALDVAANPPRDVTESFASELSDEVAHSDRNFVDVGNAIYSSKIGPEWHKVENGFRWMPKSAMVELRGPKSAAERLYITGYGAGSALAQGPVTVTVQSGGSELGSAKVTVPNLPFSFDLPLRADLVGKASLPLTIEISRTFHPPGDSRELGLIFGTFEIK